jgi:hypothetical protein
MFGQSFYARLFLVALIPLSFFGLASFPGLASFDTNVSWSAVDVGGGWESVFPIFYLLLVKISKLILDSTAIVLAMQVVSMALAISFAAKIYLGKTKLAYFVTFVVACLPSVAMVTISIWKDALFISSYVALFFTTILYFTTSKKTKDPNVVIPLLALLIYLSGSLRINGWVVIFPVIALLLWKSWNRKATLFLFTISYLLSIFTVLALPSVLGNSTKLANANSVASFALDNVQLWAQSAGDEDAPVYVNVDESKTSIKNSMRCQAWDSLFGSIDTSLIAENKRQIVGDWLRNLNDNPTQILKSRACRIAPNALPFYSEKIFYFLNSGNNNGKFPIYTGQWSAPNDHLGTMRVIPAFSSGLEMIWLKLSDQRFYALFWSSGLYIWVATVLGFIAYRMKHIDEETTVALMLLWGSALLNGFFAVSNDFRYIVPIQIISLFVIARLFSQITHTKPNVSN